MTAVYHATGVEEGQKGTTAKTEKSYIDITIFYSPFF